MNLTVQLEALEKGIFVREKNKIVHKEVSYIGKDEVVVTEYSCRLGFDDDYYEDPNIYYNISDYGRDWALTKEELADYFKLVELEQYFAGSELPSCKYVYKIGGKFNIGDLVIGMNYVGKIVKIVEDDDFLYKETKLCTDTEAYKKLIDLKTDETRRKGFNVCDIDTINNCAHYAAITLAKLKGEC